MEPEDAEELAAELRGKNLGGWALLQIATGAGLTAYLVWAGILMPGFRRVPLKLQVPYVPANRDLVENVMSLLKNRSGKMVDLGSGDGRIVLRAYQQGFSPAVGYELNPWLLQVSRYRAWKAGCDGKVSFCQEDLWKVNLSDCKNVTVFLAPSVLLLLEKKLLLELPDDARVVAGRFPLPSWRSTATAGKGLSQAWAYDIETVRKDNRAKPKGTPV